MDRNSRGHRHDRLGAPSQHTGHRSGFIEYANNGNSLASAVHELTSYNGNADTRNQHLAAWEQLWAEDATLAINNTITFTGRDSIMAFFAAAPFFNNNWVGLSPSFRTEVAIQGNTAEVYLECIFLNESKTVVAERSLNGTIKKVNGQWRFWRMNNDPAAPLF